MTHHTGAVPETRRKPDWRDQAACRDQDPELFFPNGNTGSAAVETEQAKSVCRRCPVALNCLRFALDEGITDGIFGGLTERERVATRRRAAAKKVATEEAAAHVQQASQPQPKRTLRSIWNTSAHPFADGHVIWRGTPTVYFEGRSYTPRQLSFILDRGRTPDGRVLSTCDISTCVMPSHLEDTAERSRCGTRSGYQKHLSDGTEPCAPCRQANADADNRLRRTGTTKQQAAA